MSSSIDIDKDAYEALLDMKVGEVYRRTGPLMYVGVETGDVVIVAAAGTAWVQLLVPRLGQIVTAPRQFFGNRDFWEEVTNHDTKP